MTDDTATTTAEARVERAKSRLLATLEEIRHRLSPRTVVSEAAGTVAEGANRLVAEATDTVRARPVVAAGGVAALTTLIGYTLWRRHRANAPTPTEFIPGELQ